MKKLIFFTFLFFAIASVSNAKIYYFTEVRGIANGPTNSYPFCDISGTSGCDYNSNLDVNLSFASNSAEIPMNSLYSLSFSLTGANAEDVTLSLSSNNANILEANDDWIDTTNYKINIPRTETATEGSVRLILTAINDNESVVNQDYVDVSIIAPNEDVMLSKWSISSGQNVYLPTSNSYFTQTFTGNVDWGDGSSVESFSAAKLNTLTHTYSDAGSYDMKIDGDFYGLSSTRGMFQNTGAISSSLDISNWNMANVSDAALMFQGLTTIPAGFDLSWENFAPTTLYGIFWATTALGDLDLSSWDTSNVTTIQQTFRKTNLNGDLNLSGWDLSNVTTYTDFMTGITTFTGDLIYNETVDESVYSVFLNMLVDGGLPSSSTSQKIYVGDNYCYDDDYSCLTTAQTLTANGWTIVSNHISGHVISSDNMLSKWTASAGEIAMIPTGPARTFTGYIDWGDGSAVESFVALKLSALTHTYSEAGTYNIRIDGDFYGFSNAQSMFQNIGTISSNLDISNWNVSNLTNASLMFQGTTKLPIGFNLSWDNFAPTTLYGIFWGTTALGDLDLSSWDTSNVTTIQQTFRKTILNGDLNLSGWDLSNVTTYTDFISGITTFKGDLIYDETVSSTVYRIFLRMLINGGFPLSSTSQKIYVGDNVCASGDTVCTGAETTLTGKGWVITRTTAN